MSGERYTEECKLEAAKQVTERGHPATEVAARLGVGSHSFYQWGKRYAAPPAERQKADDQQGEMNRLKAELKHVTEERDILEKAAAYFARMPGQGTPSFAVLALTIRFEGCAR
jgi:transposase